MKVGSFAPFRLLRDHPAANLSSMIAQYQPKLWPALAGFALCAAVSAAARGELSGGLSPLPDAVKRHCFQCHDNATAEAELDLEAFGKTLRGASLEVSAAADTLTKLRNVIADGEMPPEDASTIPTAAERREIIAWARGNLDRLAAQHKDDPGRVVMPRLTPAEYRNVIRDLSGGVVTNAGRFLPNEGGAGEGFSNVGEAQGINAAQFEKYLEAARGALRHLRVSPRAGMIWRTVPRDAVNKPEEARFELVNDIIAWHGEQQIVWGNGHIRDLRREHGISHGLYLEAAWRYRWRAELGQPDATFEEIARDFDAEISPLILAKWWALLHQENPSENATGVIARWNALPQPGSDGAAPIRDLCRAIESWEAEVEDDGQPQNTFAPEYELSFRDDASQAKVRAAAKKGSWPFEIEIGAAKELFLVLTDYGDGNSDDYGSWHQGEFEFEDGSEQNWQELVTIRRLDGDAVQWGYHPKREGRGPKSVGVHAPAILRFAVPDGARKFRVEFLITDNNARQSSVQALVLREAPPEKHRRVYPQRYVFGGADSRKVGKQVASFEAFEREIRKRNIPSANLTKVGLNAERNVLFDWTETDLHYIGGPWNEQPEDEPQPLIPYYFTAPEARRVATDHARRRLAELREQLAGIAQVPHQNLLDFVRSRGWKSAAEGVLPPHEFVAALSDEDRKEFEALRRDVLAYEQQLQEEAQPLLETFARRAWRRSLRKADLEMLMRLYRDARAAGFSYDGAMKGPLLAVLASPHFLYRHPYAIGDGDAAANETIPLNSYELASRLSFFLWASIPDEELLKLAAEDKLRDETVLRQQAQRMLRDPRAHSLAREFGGQLWRFSEFDNFTGPDAKRFAGFTPELREAMLREVELFLTDLFQNDGSLTSLIRSDYTFVNAELARHYGLKTEYGKVAKGQGGKESAALSGFHRVRLPAKHPRGGLTGMGLFLTKTSLPLRTSPVQRGVWVMEDVLGREMPNPPAGVPSISEDETNDKGLSIREQLEIHRAQKSCANCHDKIDPLGIALENFDAVGRWRTKLRSGEALASSAETHDGAKLDGVVGLREYLDQHRDEVFEHFNRKLLGYALGRSVGPGDAALLERMHNDLKQTGYRFSSLVDNIVASRQFRYRSTTPTTTDR